MWANQLNHGSNTVAELFGTNVPQGTILYTFDARFQIHRVNQFELSRWTSPDEVLKPGEGALIRNPGMPFTLTFSGTEPPPEFPKLLGGYNYVGFPSRSQQRLPAPLPGDELILWRNTEQRVHVWSAETSTWVPELAGLRPGEGFVYWRAEPLSPDAVTNGTLLASTKITGVVDAPVSKMSGLPMSARSVAELVVLEGGNELVIPTRLRFAKESPYSYFLQPQVVEVPGTTPGQRINIKLRAYKGYSYPLTINRGESVVISVTLGGGGLDLPGELRDLYGFAAVPAIAHFAENPHNTTVAPGSDVTLFADPGGNVRLQWRKDGQDIPGATNTLLVLPKVSGADIGVYSVTADQPNWFPMQSMAATLSLFEAKIPGQLTLWGPIGTRYLVEHASSPDQEQWTALMELVLPTSPHTFTDSTLPPDSKRFYRAVAIPKSLYGW